MKILITGGTGFVGSALTKSLLKLNHEITIISSRSKSNLEDHVKLRHLIADTTKEGDWQKHVSTMDVIINLAGRSVFHLWTEKYKKDIWNSRIQTTRNLVAAMEEGTNTVLLSASAAGYYGEGSEVEKRETAGSGDDFLAKVCKQWENEAFAAQKKGARVATMRLGVVLGSGGGAIATMKLPFLLALGGPIGSGKQWFPWIHLTDLVNAAISILQNDTMNGPFNFTAPSVTRQKEFAKTMGNILKRPAILPAPAIFMKLLLGEFGESLLQGQKVIPESLLKTGFTFSYPGIKKALEEILLG